MNLKPDFKKPIPWIIFIGIAVICAFFAIKNFDKANPLVSVKITMDRTAARNAAINLASRNILGPQNANTAIMFNTDDHFQNYVELEGGGLDSFTAIVKNGHYVPYQWIVRLFKEHETREVNFYFTPEGKSYGFTEKYPENVKGLALSADTARALAEKEAVKKWGINLNRYSLVEKSKETKISGRVDHTFVYEENRQKIGEATYRLRLVVSGGRLSEVKHFMKIPEDFDRRYDEMRSANNTVASFGTIGLVVVYGIGGVIIGLFFLLRKRRIIWKNPLAWGFAIAFCSVFLVTLNSIPLSWFDYDTSTSALNFLLQRILASGLFGALGMGAVIALTIMAAEGLGRLAFPRHTQLWKAWSPAAGGSISILGQTVAGYLFMAVVVALDVAYYLLARHWGWWSPASPLSDPNILANYMPWLDPFATSFQAGFWEESLCRAVPLAGIVLLTRKSKYRVLWIGAVLVLQTLIFGAAHANYPQEPSYARVFEMMLPFTIMGLIYLGFGLIPAVIAHFTVDVFWISLPLWVASSPGIWFDRLMVLVLLFIPLWIVLFYRIKQKHWNSFPDDLRNGAWKEETQIEENVEPEERIELPGSPWKKYLIPLGLAGILLWSVFTTFKKDSPPLKINRQEALKIASEAVVKQFKIKPAEWTIVGNIDQNTNLEHRFVWTKFGKQGYNQLLGKFVNPQLWKVRFVKIKGKVEERTEEYSVDITPEGKVINAQHIFPENRAGANLTKESAQVIVDSILKKEFGVERTDLEEISARPEKLNKRINWEFIYSDTVAYKMNEGQGRYLVSLAGSEYQSAYAYVYVPEQWERDYQNMESQHSIIRSIGIGLTVLIIIAGIVVGILRWSRKKFSARLFVIAALSFLFLELLDLFNLWPIIISAYDTSVPLDNFITMSLVYKAISSIFVIAGLGLVAGMSVKLEDFKNNNGWFQAICLGLFVYGVLALIGRFEPKVIPDWENFSYAAERYPMLAIALSGIKRYVVASGLIMIVVFALNKFTHRWTKRKVVYSILTLLLGIAIQASSLENYGFWILSGTVVGGALLVSYIVFLRYHFTWIPLVGVVPVILGMIRIAISDQYHATTGGAILGIIIISWIAMKWHKLLQNN